MGNSTQIEGAVGAFVTLKLIDKIFGSDDSDMKTLLTSIATDVKATKDEVRGIRNDVDDMRKEIDDLKRYSSQHNDRLKSLESKGTKTS